MKRYLDDDENVIAMRETAKQVGLTHLLRKAIRAKSLVAIRTLLDKALRLLGEK